MGKCTNGLIRMGSCILVMHHRTMLKRPTRLRRYLPRGTSSSQVDSDKELKSQVTNRSVKKAPPLVETPAPVMADANVEMFMTSWCGYCKKTREYFQARGIAITEYDVETDPAAAQRKQEILPSPGVPLVVINGTPIQGYSPHAFEQALQGR